MHSEHQLTGSVSCDQFSIVVCPRGPDESLPETKLVIILTEPPNVGVNETVDPLNTPILLGSPGNTTFVLYVELSHEVHHGSTDKLLAIVSEESLNGGQTSPVPSLENFL